MIWRIIWGAPSVLSVLGAIVVIAAVFFAALVALATTSARLDRRRRDGCRLPLPLLRAWTYRKRRRASRDLIVPDWAGQPLSRQERAVLDSYERKAR